VFPLSPLDRITTCIVDLDGVVWTRNAVVPGAVESLRALLRAGYRILYVTNNSSMSRRSIIEKLRRFDIPADPGAVISSTRATAEYILEASGRVPVFVLGSDGLAEDLREAGLEVVQEPERARFLAVGFDRDLSYRKLALALKALLAGARFVAANEDATLPSEEGLLPAAGAMVGAVKGMIRREPEAVIGKPNACFVEKALLRLGICGSECIVVGDSIASDVALAKKMNMPSVLVLTGNTTRGDVERSALRPDYVIDSIAGLADLFRARESTGAGRPAQG
jgi:HAD superfamily hydrolase (TIGR01457 family)